MITLLVFVIGVLIGIVLTYKHIVANYTIRPRSRKKKPLFLLGWFRRST